MWGFRRASPSRKNTMAPSDRAWSPGAFMSRAKAELPPSKGRLWDKEINDERATRSSEGERGLRGDIWREEQVDNTSGASLYDSHVHGHASGPCQVRRTLGGRCPRYSQCARPVQR